MSVRHLSVHYSLTYIYKEIGKFEIINKCMLKDFLLSFLILYGLCMCIILYLFVYLQRAAYSYILTTLYQ